MRGEGVWATTAVTGGGWGEAVTVGSGEVGAGGVGGLIMVFAGNGSFGGRAGKSIGSGTFGSIVFWGAGKLEIG